MQAKQARYANAKKEIGMTSFRQQQHKLIMKNHYRNAALDFGNDFLRNSL